MQLFRRTACDGVPGTRDGYDQVIQIEMIDGESLNLPTGQDEDVLHNMLVTCAEASVPYAFRKSTGLVAELSFIAGRTLQFLHETLSVARVLNEGLDALLSNSVAVERLRTQVRQTRAGGELLSNDLHPMYAIVIVNLCAALDAGIDDTLTGC